MMNTTEPKKLQPDKSWFLTELIGAKVVCDGRTIGQLTDITVEEIGPIPHVRSLVVHRPFGDPQLIIPIEQITTIASRLITVDLESTAIYEHKILPEVTLLKDYLLDKKVIDTEDREVSIVYDVRIIMINKKLYVSEVDFSRYGLLRRLGFAWAAPLLNIKQDLVSWMYIQSLPTDISSFKGSLKLKTLRETLSDMPAVDIADIIEELDREQRALVFGGLESDHASDTLEEVDPSVQRELIATMAKDSVAQLVNQMTPAQAADILSVLSHVEKESILLHLDTHLASRVKLILERQDEDILHYTTTRILTYHPAEVVSFVHETYAENVKNKDVHTYLYIVNSDNILEGVLESQISCRTKAARI